jgi:hypothetical protein
VFRSRFKANQGLGGGDFAAHEGAGKVLFIEFSHI